MNTYVTVYRMLMRLAFMEYTDVKEHEIIKDSAEIFNVASEVEDNAKLVEMLMLFITTPAYHINDIDKLPKANFEFLRKIHHILSNSEIPEAVLLEYLVSKILRYRILHDEIIYIDYEEPDISFVRDSLALGIDVVRRLVIEPSMIPDEIAPIPSRMLITTYSDQNENAGRDIGEPGLNGTNITVVDSEGTIYHLVTDANGDIYTPYLPEGTLTVTIDSVVIPNGFTLSDLQITEGSLQSDFMVGMDEDMHYSVGFVMPKTATVKGNIFEDRNGDGSFNTGDINLGGVPISLLMTNGVTRTTTTDGSGFYTFDFVLLGQFTVTVDTEYTLSYGRKLTECDITTGSTPLTDNVQEENSVKLLDPIGFNFPAGTITGNVYIDFPNIGVKDGDDISIRNIKVVALASDGTVYGTTTDDDGNYSISGIPAGTVNMLVDNEYITQNGSPLSTYTQTEGVGNIQLAANTTVTVNLGFKPKSADFTGTVFEDTDGNGVMNNEEHPLAGATVMVKDAFGIEHTTTTDSAGTYSFENIPTGYMHVLINGDIQLDSTGTLTDAVCTNADMPDNSLTLTDSGITKDYGFRSETGVVTLKLFEDLDNDGVKNNDDGYIDGVIVKLKYSNGLELSATSDAAGTVRFEYAPTGSCHLEFDPTSSFNNVAIYDYRITTGGPIPKTVVVTYNEENVLPDIGLKVPVGSVTGMIYLDTDANGSKGINDRAVEGITVTATQGSRSFTTTTDDTGNYLFEEIQVGLVTITIDNTYTFSNNVVVSNCSITQGALTTDTSVQTAGANVELTPVGIAMPAHSVSGILFKDTNLNNAFDTNEPLVSGVEVKALGSSLNVLFITTTDNDGRYTFDIPDDTYTITIEESYLLDGIRLDAYELTLGASLTMTETITSDTLINPIGFKPKTTDFSVSVLETIQTDGGYSYPEDAVDGIEVTVVDPYGNSTTVITSNGIAIFEDIVVGTISITVPGDFVLPSAALVSEDTLVSGPNPTITIEESQDRIDIVYAASKADISGRVYEDDQGETNAPNINVTLVDKNGVTHTAVTDANGVYNFDAIPLGTATLSFGLDDELPSGVTIGSSDNIAGRSNPYTLEITPALNIVDGFTAKVGKVKALIFHDKDGDGSKGTIDTGIEGIEATLTTFNGNVITATADVSGYVTFDGVPIGDFTITVDEDHLIKPYNNIWYKISDFDCTTHNGTFAGTANDDNTTSFPNIGYHLVVCTVRGRAIMDFDKDTTFSIGDVPVLDNVNISITYHSAHIANIAIAVRPDADGYFEFEYVSKGVAEVRIDDAEIIYEDKRVSDAECTTINPISFTVSDSDDGTTKDIGILGFYVRRKVGVSGDIYIDKDFSGNYNTGDETPSGITVTATEEDGTQHTTTTDSHGHYIFTGIPIGWVTINIGTSGDALSGYIVSENDYDFDIEVTIDGANVAPIVGYQLPRHKVSGIVFEDINGNGTYENDEDMITDVAVELTDVCGNTYTTRTSYSIPATFTFDAIPIGSYTITIDGTRAMPTSGIISDAIVTGLANPYTGTLTTDTTDLKFSFQPKIGAIKGQAYEDTNNNGTYDSSESYLVGREVTASDAYGNNLTTTIASDGWYTFPEIRSGNVTVSMSVDGELPSGAPLLGSLVTEGSLNQTFNLAPGATLTADRIGLYPNRKGTIKGTVYLDMNGDGSLGLGDATLNGATVILTDTLGVVHSVSAGNQGLYVFTDIPEGNATIEVDPNYHIANGDTISQCTQTQGANNTVTVVNNENITATPMGFRTRQANFKFSVFRDMNGNYQYDSQDDSVLGGLTIKLTNSFGIIHRVETDSQGVATFANVPVGDITVDLDNQDYVVYTTIHNVEIKPDDCNPVQLSLPYTATLSTDELVTLGLQPKIGEYKYMTFDDKTGDGYFDPTAGEVVLDGVTIRLTDNKDNMITVLTNNQDGIVREILSGSVLIEYLQTTGTMDDGSPVSGASCTTNNQSTNVNIPVNDQTPMYKIGFQSGIPVCQHAKGFIYNDADGDGYYTPTDVDPISQDVVMDGVTVTLTDSVGTVHTTTTDVEGNYEFLFIRTGSATIVADVDSSLVVTEGNNPQPMNIVESNTMISPSLGLHAVSSGSISGRIYESKDDNNTYDDNTDVLLRNGDVTFLNQDTNETFTASINLNGTFKILNKPLGTYTYTVSPDTQVGNYTIADIDSVVQGSLTGEITITANDPDGDIGDIGVKMNLAGPLRVYVFEDINGNAVKDGDEQIITEGRVQIKDSLNHLFTKNISGTNGAFFDGIVAGDIQVRYIDLIGDPNAPYQFPSGASTGNGVIFTVHEIGDTFTLPANTATEITYGAHETYHKATVSLSVFEDFNSDGVANNYDLAIPDVTAKLIQLSDGTEITGEYVTNSSSAHFNFPNVVMDPQGHRIIIDPNSGTMTSGNHLSGGELTVGSLDFTGTTNTYEVLIHDPLTFRVDGIVFHDVNTNGTYEEGTDIVDTNDNNSSVNIYDENNQVVATPIINDDGYYYTSPLPLGTYRLEVRTDIGYYEGFTCTTNNQPYEFTINTSGYHTLDDIGLHKEARASVTGFVYDDVDADGTFDSNGDLTPNRAEVRLTDSEGTVHTTTADTTGHYSFTDLPIGNVSIEVETHSGVYNGYVVSEGHNPTTFNAPAGDSVADDIGLKRPLIRVSGRALEDIDNNMTPTAGDSLLNNLGITLYDPYGVAHTTRTGTDGRYLFENIPAGPIRVIFDGNRYLPHSTQRLSEITHFSEGELDSTRTLTVTQMAWNIAAVPNVTGSNGTIKQYVYLDIDEDGIQDLSDTPVEGANVRVTLPDGSYITKPTLADGYAVFVDVPNESLTVEALIDGVLANTECTTNNNPQSVNVPSGAVGTGQAMGFKRTG